MMISMTGFASKVFQEDGYTFTLTLKSLNHRYLEINFFGLLLPPDQEIKIRKMIKERIYRGKIDVFLDQQKEQEFNITPELNIPLLEQLIEKTIAVSKKYRRRVVFSLDPFLRNPLVLNFGNSPSRTRNQLPDIEKHFRECLNELIASRRQEGQEILNAIKSGAERIESLLTTAANLANNAENGLTEILRARIGQLIGNLEFDETKIITESAFLAARISVTEELNRLSAHFKRFKNLLEDQGDFPRGKEFDFLMQEMLRETHTIISKTQSEELIDTTIEIRKQVDAIRQQIQNIE